MSQMKNITWIAITLSLFTLFLTQAQSTRVNDYAVVWNNPSKNSSGAMPIGNGEVGANVWMEDNGNLLFYLSRTDAWAENSSLYKLGRVRISLYPALPVEGTRFQQKLNLKEGKIEIEMNNGGRNVRLDFLVDRGSPVVYVKGETSYPVQVTVSSEIWRTQTRVIPEAERHFALMKCPHDSLVTEYADHVASEDNHVIVYHRNEHSIYPFTLKHQDLENEYNKDKDPLIHRTMGYNMSGEEFVTIAPTMLVSKRSLNEFCLKIAAYTEQTETVREWIFYGGSGIYG